MKPISQLFELIVEKLPMFPYGKGYYQELENIWYNKYEGDIVKTQKKVKQLKAKMVQKLIFQPLIDYAYSKVNKVQTLDSWFLPIETNNTIEIKEDKDIDENKKVEKTKHEVKVKKTKQMSLDAFF
jgi:hypothetical protein